MQHERPDVVILAAARVGGIHANNTYPGQFIYDNLMIQANLIHQAHEADIQRLLFLGSSCIYPREAPQPMAEDALLTGRLEPTNEPYAIAKIAGIKLCESYNRQYGRDYRSVMPTNLYGPGDNFHPENAHVLPALLRRFHEAKQSGLDEVTIWGTGTPRREFLHVDDMAEASLFVLDLDQERYAENTEPMLSHINVGTGEDVAISELAELLREVTGFQGKIEFDPPRRRPAQAHERRSTDRHGLAGRHQPGGGRSGYLSVVSRAVRRNPRKMILRSLLRCITHNLPDPRTGTKSPC